jgi:uncharacterized protein with HEPN domain
MQHDERAFLWDVRNGTDAILGFVRGRTLDDYRADLMLRSAVERQFEIIGEALSQLGKLSPQLVQQIPDIRRIIAFRNLLIHGYAVVDHQIVWRTITEKLPDLRARVERMVADLGEKP